MSVDLNICLAGFDEPQNTSGVTSWVISILPAWIALGHQVSCAIYSFCPPNEKGALECFLIESQIPYRRIQMCGSGYTDALSQWAVDAVRELGSNVFIPNCIVPAWYASDALESVGVHCVGVTHSPTPLYEALALRCASSQSGRKMSAIVTVSRFLSQTIGKIVSPATWIEAIPCGIPDPLELSGPVKEMSPFKLVYVGRLVEEAKRISEVGLCCRAAVESIPNLEVDFWGAGPDQAALEAILNASPSRERLRVRGWAPVDKVREILRQYHAIVLLSDYEGMPVSVLEGMSLGLIPIVSQMPTGIEELVRSGVNGVVVQRDPGKFTRVVQDLIEDEDHKFQKMSQAAFETVRTEYSIGVTAQKWVNLLSSIVERKELPLSSRSTVHVKLPPRHPALAEYDLRPPGVWERIVGRVRRQFTSKK